MEYKTGAPPLSRFVRQGGDFDFQLVLERKLNQKPELEMLLDSRPNLPLHPRQVPVVLVIAFRRAFHELEEVPQHFALR